MARVERPIIVMTRDVKSVDGIKSDIQTIVQPPPQGFWTGEFLDKNGKVLWHMVVFVDERSQLDVAEQIRGVEGVQWAVPVGWKKSKSRSIKGNS